MIQIRARKDSSVNRKLKGRDGEARDDRVEDGGSSHFERSRKEGHAGGRPKEDGHGLMLRP